MIINKKMRDGNFIEIEVDEVQGAFLLKHDPKKYSTGIETSDYKLKNDEIPDLKIEDVKEEEIPDFKDEE
jgi:hypothetical protein